MIDADQQIASRLRRLLEADGFIDDAKDLLTEYSKRVRAVNDRLALAAKWLREGLLSEAIGYSEEWMDAVDSARDLDLGNENYAKLRQLCRESTMEAPPIVDRQSAWEIGNAYVMYADASHAISRYRGACMAGFPLEARLVTLKDACLAATRTREQLGPTGDTVLRALTGQAPVLVEAVLKQLALEAGPIVRKIKERAASANPGQPGKVDDPQVTRLVGRFSALDNAVKEINQCFGEVRLDLHSDPAVRYFMELRDHEELLRLLRKLDDYKAVFLGAGEAGGGAGGNLKPIREIVRSIDRILERKLASLPREAVELVQHARLYLAADERRVNEQPEAAQRLRDLLDDPRSTPREYKKAYDELVKILQGPPEESLNRAYNERRARDQKARRARLIRIAKFSPIGIAAVVVLALVPWGKLMSPATAEPAGDPDAASVTDDPVAKLKEAIKANKIDVMASLISQPVGGKPILELSDFKAERREIELRCRAYSEFVQLEEKLANLTGLESVLDPKLVNNIKEYRAQLGEMSEAIKSRLTKAEESAGTLQKKHDEAITLAVSKKKKAVEITESIANAEKQAEQMGLDSLRSRYEKAVADWGKLVGTDSDPKADGALSRQIPKESAAELEEMRLDLESRRDELLARIDVLDVAKHGPKTLGDIVGIYSKYRELSRHQQPAIIASLGEVLKDEKSIAAVSPVFEAAELIASSSRQWKQSDAELAAKGCDPAFSNLIPGLDESDLEALRSYFNARAAYEAMRSQDKDPLAFGVTENLFKTARWRPLKYVVSDDGDRFFTLDGTLERLAAAEPVGDAVPATSKPYYKLDRVPKRNKKLENSDLGVENVPISGAAELSDAGLAALADGVVSLMRDAREGKAEPLTANLIVIERVRAAILPPPLRAKLVRPLLALQKKLKWPESPACDEIADRIEKAGTQLDDDALWAPRSKVQKAFEDWLKSDAVPNLEEFAKRENDRIARACRLVGAFRLVGVARKSEPDAIAWFAGGGGGSSARFRGDVFAVRGTAERPVLQKIGSVGRSGGAVWDSGKTPPDGTPLIGRFQD